MFTPLEEKKTQVQPPISPVAYKEPQRLDLALNLPIAQEVTLPATLHLAPRPVDGQTNLTAVAQKPEQGFSLRHWISRFWKQEWTAKVRKAAPWLISGTILGINLWIQAPTFVLGALMVGMTIRVVKSIVRSNPFCQKIWQKLLDQAGIKEEKLAMLTAAFAGGSWMTVSSPSHAILFDRAQTYATTLFNNAGGTTAVTALVPLIFGILRLIFVLYIGIAIIRCINAFRNEEDWTTAARIPVVVVFSIFVGDALTNMVVPA